LEKETSGRGGEKERKPTLSAGHGPRGASDKGKEATVSWRQTGRKESNMRKTERQKSRKFKKEMQKRETRAVRRANGNCGSLALNKDTFSAKKIGGSKEWAT